MAEIDWDIQRRPSSTWSTIGELKNEHFQHLAFTLEPPVRETKDRPSAPGLVPGWVATWKIPKKTAIPEGRYQVVKQWSPKFAMDTLWLVDVPGFVNVEVHPGNYPSDTDGCTLLGQTAGPDPDFIGSSRAACATVYAAADVIFARGDTLWLSYFNP